MMHLPTCLTARIARTLLLAALVAPASAPSAAEELRDLATGASRDLELALADLAAARQEVEAERIPMARRLNELEQKLVARKAEWSKAQRFQENQLVELNALKAEARLRSEEVKYVDSLLSEYARAFRSRLNFMEEPQHQPLFDAVEKAGAAPDLSPAARFEQRSPLLTTALRRGEEALGGLRLQGRALDPQGRIQAGRVAVIGPVAMFASDSGEMAGVLQQELNRADPTVVRLAGSLNETSRALVTTGQGSLALDATLGNAFKLAALDKGMVERLAEGGWIMIPLLGLGLAMVLASLIKWFQLARIRLATEADLQQVLRHLGEREPERALQVARGIPGPAGELLTTAVEHVEEKKEYIEEILYEKMLGARARLERGLAFLALAATTGPLLGLLGTVMGMISTFKMISSFGSGDPKQLAAGISEALICTATGMAVAIPALLSHAFLGRKAKGILGSMEQTAVGFVNGVPAKEPTELSVS
jgi:biopolymer transport protein ExbB